MKCLKCEKEKAISQFCYLSLCRRCSLKIKYYQIRLFYVKEMRSEKCIKINDDVLQKM